MKLTIKQQRFCDYYIQSGNAEEAAKKAGYNARGNTTKLLQNTTIREHLEARNKLLENERIADMKEVKEFWTETMRNESIEYKDRIKVSELIGKTNGAFLDRVEQTNIDIVVDIEEDDIDD